MHSNKNKYNLIIFSVFLLSILALSALSINNVNAGDVTIDNTGNIEGAINDSTINGEEGIVNLVTGEYLITDTINVGEGKTLTIRGDGGSKPTINGNGLRIFNVSAGAKLTLENLIIINGHSDYGGAIFLNNSILKMF